MEMHGNVEIHKDLGRAIYNILQNIRVKTFGNNSSCNNVVECKCWLGNQMV